MGEDATTVRLTSASWLPRLRDGDDLEIRFEMVGQAFVGKPEETAKTQQGRLVVGVSRSLAAVWGLDQDDLRRVLLEHGRRHIRARIEEGGTPLDDEVSLTTYNTPNEVPFEPSRIAPLEEPLLVITTPESDWAPPEERDLMGEIITLRDNINALAGEKYQFRLLTLPNERMLLELGRQCTSAEEFSYRLQALSGLATSMDEVRLRAEVGEKEGRSLALVGKLLRRDFEQALVYPVMNTLSGLNRLRQGYPTHTDRADGVLAAHDHFGLEYPIANHRKAWSTLLAAYRDALNQLFELFSVHRSR